MQACVSEGIATLEKATHLVNQLSLFSSNEAVEEVSTTDLKWVCECVFVRVGGWGRGYILIRMYVHVHYLQFLYVNTYFQIPSPSSLVRRPNSTALRRWPAWHRQQG